MTSSGPHVIMEDVGALLFQLCVRVSGHKVDHIILDASDHKAFCPLAIGNESSVSIPRSRNKYSDRVPLRTARTACIAYVSRCCCVRRRASSYSSSSLSIKNCRKVFIGGAIFKKRAQCDSGRGSNITFARRRVRAPESSRRKSPLS